LNRAVRRIWVPPSAPDVTQVCLGIQVPRLAPDSDRALIPAKNLLEVLTLHIEPTSEQIPYPYNGKSLRVRTAPV